MVDTYNEQTFSVMQRLLRKDSNCVDIGCHTREILREMLQLSPDGVHWAFEPIPNLYNYLRQEFTNVKVYSFALSDTESESTFHYVVSNPGYSGLKKRRYDRTQETVEVITVQTNLLDNVIPPDTKIDFIKIDVEGGELQVFRGAINTIRRNKPVIVFEHGLGAADFYGTEPTDVYDILTDGCGLQVSLMQSWLDRQKPLERQKFVTQFKNGTNYYFIAHPPS